MMKKHTQKRTRLHTIARRNTVTLRKSLFLSVFSAFLIITLSLGCFSIWSQAQTKDEPQLYKYYTNIEVQYGDTMWDIASRYCTAPYTDYNSYINEVMRINRILEPELKAGGSLIIPYYSAELKK
ncbi:MAG: LysM peptidoglycan-binding domain-containing protein [Lachnospiraceae bacterium]|nr:LysM peptidoglycan-binding domain-containing protein [Lachnospiraceae bacterium]